MIIGIVNILISLASTRQQHHQHSYLDQIITIIIIVISQNTLSDGADGALRATATGRLPPTFLNRDQAVLRRDLRPRTCSRSANLRSSHPIGPGPCQVGLWIWVVEERSSCECWWASRSKSVLWCIEFLCLYFVWATSAIKHRSGARQQLISQKSYLNGQPISVNRVTTSRIGAKGLGSRRAGPSSTEPYTTPGQGPTLLYPSKTPNNTVG